MNNLDLALIGNSNIAALIDGDGRYAWACLPRLDGDAVFCELLSGDTPPADGFGNFAVELHGHARSEQSYIAHTPILRTRLWDSHGSGIEVTDFAPRTQQYNRTFYPMMLVRKIAPIAGSPRVRIRLRPACEYGARRAAMTWGSNHVRFILPDVVLRGTADCPVTALLEETELVLRESIYLILGPDETLLGGVAETAQRFLDETAAYWRQWVRGLALPFEWQEPIIRAAITLKLNTFDDTGAIIAAVTTSIPESDNSTRNWDYRYCWLRDAYFVVNALNRLNATVTMEHYLDYIVNIAAGSEGRDLQPVYRINGLSAIDESQVASLPGYRGMGPVRIGNQAYLQSQNDVYGSAVLAAAHMFFDARLALRGNEALFRQLEQLGERAAVLYDQPDAGLWELRGARRVHTFSSVMCWVACDRLARIAVHIGIPSRAAYWRARADTMQQVIAKRAFNVERNTFVSTFEGDQLDASLLLLAELHFVACDDPRFAGTVAAVERDLKRGDLIFRYTEADDFGAPDNAFTVCTFWYIDALVALGRREEARALFERTIAHCNRHGLLSEHIDPATGEQWGNFPQTYSMVGLVNSAMRLSISWNEVF